VFMREQERAKVVGETIELSARWPTDTAYASIRNYQLLGVAHGRISHRRHLT
jgi:hypothetical protein